MSASLPDEALTLLRRTGLAGPSETPRARALSGGVSSDIWRVELARGPVCLKRALPRLRVAQRWEAPIERNRYERLWMEAAARAVPGSAPRVLGNDDAAGLFAMECIDAPLWKDELRQGRADPAFAARVGAALAAIHAATAGREDIALLFRTDEIFYAIRLEPYLVFTGTLHPDLGLEELAYSTAQTKVCLVHGDVSPKNILVGGEGPAHFPVFLDAECAWYGDPAFDLAFCLNHLLLKSVWVPNANLGSCFDKLSNSYLERFSPGNLEERAAALLPALLLARVDGKSPVEYLGDEEKSLVRKKAREMFGVRTLKDAWRRFST